MVRKWDLREPSGVNGNDQKGSLKGGLSAAGKAEGAFQGGRRPREIRTRKGEIKAEDRANSREEGAQSYQTRDGLINNSSSKCGVLISPGDLLSLGFICLSSFS